MNKFPTTGNAPEGMNPQIESEGESFEYQLLVGHRRTDGTYKTDDQLRTEYVRRTDDLVYKLTEGISVTDPETGEKSKKPYDYVVFLDKSARPLSWMVREFWPMLGTDQDGNPMPQPQHRFVNIDKQQWVKTLDRNGIGVQDISTVDDSVIRSLRSIFLISPKDREDGLTERIDESPTQFDGKAVLIVDEVHSSGDTLSYAQSFFKRAFPNATIAGTHWMGGVTMKNGATGNADLPVWYNDKSVYGRGVGDRHEKASLKSHNPTQRLGAWFLSSALHGGPDEKSVRLRREIHQLALDVREHRVLLDPSHERDANDFVRRAVVLNGLAGYEQFKQKKVALNEAKS